jgi:hypothetical protein
MLTSDICDRVRACLDDQDGTYIDDAYILSHAQHQYEKLFNKLYLTDSQFDEIVVELPNVAAGTPDLSAYLADGKALALLVTPRFLEWKLAGQPAVNYRKADGPLDALRDQVPGGRPLLDSWVWSRRVIRLSTFSAALDLRITGTFLFEPLTSVDSPIQMDVRANVVLVYLIAEAIAIARGNPGWMAAYKEEKDDAFDDLLIAKVKEEQSRTERVARISRPNRTGGVRPATS